MSQNARLALWVPTEDDAAIGEVIEIRGGSDVSKVIPTDFRPQAGASGGIGEAPADDNFYARRNVGWEMTVGEAPSNGQLWARKNNSWQVVAPFPEAPTDGKQYARSNAAWVEVTSMPPVIDGGTF